MSYPARAEGLGKYDKIYIFIFSTDASLKLEQSGDEFESFVNEAWTLRCELDDGRTRGNDEKSLREQRNFTAFRSKSSTLYYHQIPTRRYRHASSPTQSPPITGQRNTQLPPFWSDRFDHH